MWKAFITGSVTEHLLCSITANLPENLIRLAFAFNPVLIWKLKFKEVNKFAKITQLINSRGKIQSQVCVAPEPILFPLSLLRLPRTGVSSLVMKDLDSDPRGAAEGILDRPVLCALQTLGSPRPLTTGECAPRPTMRASPSVSIWPLEVVVNSARKVGNLAEGGRERPGAGLCMVKGESESSQSSRRESRKKEKDLLTRTLKAKVSLAPFL